MRIEYKNEATQRYLVINRLEEEKNEKTYEINMLKNNSIKGLLEFRENYFNGHEQLYYNISAKQVLIYMYENKKISLDVVKNLFMSLCNVIDELERYLVSADGLMLNPEYIYVNMDTVEFYFCYCLSTNQQITGSIKELVEYVMKIIDHKDKDLVQVVYRMHQLLQGDGFTREDIRECFATEVDKACMTVEDELIKDNIKNNDNAKIKDQIYSFTNELDTKSDNALIKEERKIYTPMFYIQIGGVFLISLIVMGLVSYIAFAKSAIPAWFGIFADVLIIAAATYGASWISTNSETATRIDIVDIKPLRKITNKQIREKVKEASKAVLKDNTFKNFEEEVEIGTILLGDLRKSRLHALQLLEGEEVVEGKVIELSHYPCSIGKVDKDVDIIINNPLISRLHARISSEEEMIFVEDMNSTNGTFINGLRIPPYTKKDINIGDHITFANCRYLFK